MKQVYIFFITISLIGCIHREEDSYLTHVIVQNSSNQEIELSIYQDEDEFNYENLHSSFLIPANESKIICSSTSEDIGDLNICFPDKTQILVVFPNGKGHYCSSFSFVIDDYDNSECFNKEERLLGSAPSRKSAETVNDHFEVTYIITQEDYDNAHELPE